LWERNKSNALIPFLAPVGIGDPLDAIASIAGRLKGNMEPKKTDYAAELKRLAKKHKIVISPQLFKKYSPEEIYPFVLNMLDTQERESAICVVYASSCNCNENMHYMLDRFPMSSEIHSVCLGCKKWCLMEISDPIRFFSPLTDTEFGLDELNDATICAGFQEEFLKGYQKLANRNR
jgi:hypothetical protein